MATAPPQRPPKRVATLNTLPGVQRDGTRLDTARYNDAQWTRWQRGRPKKMNGYRQINEFINGPVRASLVWTRQDLTQITTLSPTGIEATQLDKNGIGQSLFDRTPANWVYNPDVIWQHDTMYDSAAGSDKTLVFAHGASNLKNIDSGELGDVYFGDAASTLPLEPIGASVQVSGGLVALPPYLVVYGSDGLVRWSNANEPRTFDKGDAGSARVTGTKVVRALPIRGQGQSPAALLWSLDSVLKMTFVGGQAIFRFETLSNESSVLSSNSMIEYDGIYYWIGVDRFMFFNGTVQELPNDQNQNYFFDSLNYDQRQKVHATKITRYGEIWWFFPKDGAEECTHAVIYNVREKYWYDVELPRSSGVYSQVFRFPIMTDSTPTAETIRLKVSAVTGTFSVGDTIVGSASLTSGKIRKILGNNFYVVTPKATKTKFQVTETIQGPMGSATVGTPLPVSHHSLWLHEVGKNRVQGDQELSILSYFETSDFGYPTGGADGDKPMGDDRWSRLTRIEPDFVQVGPMEVEVLGSETAKGLTKSLKKYEFNPSTERIDVREQQREIRLKFTSNTVDGDFEMGKILLHLEQGDTRS